MRRRIASARRRSAGRCRCVPRLRRATASLTAITRWSCWAGGVAVTAKVRCSTASSRSASRSYRSNRVVRTAARLVSRWGWAGEAATAGSQPSRTALVAASRSAGSWEWTYRSSWARPRKEATDARFSASSASLASAARSSVTEASRSVSSPVPSNRIRSTCPSSARRRLRSGSPVADVARAVRSRTMAASREFRAAVPHVRGHLGRRASLVRRPGRRLGQRRREAGQHRVTELVVGGQFGEGQAHEADPTRSRVLRSDAELGHREEAGAEAVGDVRPGLPAAGFSPGVRQERAGHQDRVRVILAGAGGEQRPAHGVHGLVRRHVPRRALGEGVTQRLRHGGGAHRVHDPEEEGARVTVPALPFGQMPHAFQVVGGRQVHDVEDVRVRGGVRRGEPVTVVEDVRRDVAVGLRSQHLRRCDERPQPQRVRFGHRRTDGSAYPRAQFRHPPYPPPLPCRRARLAATVARITAGAG